jgi:hypothetical protein
MAEKHLGFKGSGFNVQGYRLQTFNGGNFSTFERRTQNLEPLRLEPWMAYNMILDENLFD